MTPITDERFAKALQNCGASFVKNMVDAADTLDELAYPIESAQMIRVMYRSLNNFADEMEKYEKRG